MKNYTAYRLLILNIQVHVIHTELYLVAVLLLAI